MATEWKKVKLGEISNKIQTGPFGSQLHMSDYSDNGTPVVMPKDMINGKISEETIARVSEEHVKRLSRHIVTEGNILYARRGDVGKCVYVTKYETGWLCGTGCLNVDIDTNIADSKFIFYHLQNPDTVGWVYKNAKGATMPNLNTDILSDVPLQIPSIQTQRKIASILSAYDDLIENNNKQIKLLEEEAQKLYKEWFVKLNFPGHENVKIVDGVPEGWKKEKLINLVDVQYGYAFDGKFFNSERKGTPIVRIRNIPDGTTNDFTTENAPEDYKIHNGDILVGMDGEFHINTWNQGEAYLVQRSCSIRPNKEIMKGYILQAIYKPIKFFEKTVVGATVSHLGKKHIDTIEILTCPDEFYVPFDNFLKKKQTLQNQIQLLQLARDKLLPKLMNQEIEVTA